MNLQDYIDIRREISVEAVSLGYRTVSLFRPEEVPSAQIGYSVNSSGEALTGNYEGGWKSAWLVVATEDLLGDPIFIDLDVAGLPVFTSAHGSGTWRPTMIASSFSNFIQSLREIEAVARNRRNPVQLERNPLSSIERDHVLGRIKVLNDNVSLDFWETWLDG